MKESIERLDINDEFYTSERCFITEVSNTSNDPDVSIARARVAPGVTTRWHHLKDIVERYVVLEGKGLVEVGELAAQQLNIGDVVVIPAMCRQRITNVGSKDLVFLAICSPRFVASAYVEFD